MCRNIEIWKPVTQKGFWDIQTESETILKVLEGIVLLLRGQNPSQVLEGVSSGYRRIKLMKPFLPCKNSPFPWQNRPCKYYPSHGFLIRLMKECTRYYCSDCILRKLRGALLVAIYHSDFFIICIYFDAFYQYPANLLSWELSTSGLCRRSHCNAGKLSWRKEKKALKNHWKKKQLHSG